MNFDFLLFCEQKCPKTAEFDLEKVSVRTAESQLCVADDPIRSLTRFQDALNFETGVGSFISSNAFSQTHLMSTLAIQFPIKKRFRKI